MSDSQPNVRERVYCHSCRNRWERDEHGLICPNCESEFVEIQEHGVHPSSPESTFDESPLSQGFLSPGGPQQFFPRNDQTGSGANTFMGGIFGLLQQMASMPQQLQQQEAGDTRSFSYSTPSGSTRISFRSTTLGPGGMSPGPQSPHDHAFQGLFGEPFRPPGSPPVVGPDVTVPQLFNFMFGLGNGQRTGDVAWSQEEMDRIVSQLMEQHGRTAPGPATADAIEELPKKTVDESMMEDGKAECTICMDEVELGDIVTQLYCKHWFHTQCITVWLREHDTCPHCRKSIEESKKEAEEKDPSSATKPSKSRRSSSTHSVPTQTHPSSSRNYFPRRSSRTRSAQHDSPFDSLPNLSGRSPRPYPSLHSPFDISPASLQQGSYTHSFPFGSPRRTSASPQDRFSHYHNTPLNGYMEPTTHRPFERDPYRRRSEVPESWETDFERELLRDEQRRAGERRFLERNASDRRPSRRASNGNRRSSSYMGSTRDRERERERERSHRSSEADNANESRGIFDRVRDLWRGPSQH